jgi:hypothetical protein
MKRVRFGFKVRLPFGIFPHAAIFVKQMNVTDAAKLEGGVTNLRMILQGIGMNDIAERLVFDVQ